MINLARKEDCCGCFACESICPVKCIKMVPDSEGFVYLDIDKEACTNCGQCDDVCPMNRTVEIEKKPETFAAWSLDNELRKKSSSGGVFSVLAKQTINQKGVVFGAAIFSDGLRHIPVENIDDLEKLQGSKYIESIIGDTFKKARDFLKLGRQVLFSGTPCQIAGLKRFLKVEYENLITVDLICHGVPSPEVFDAYRRQREEITGSKVSQIYFRDKSQGWKKFSMNLVFENKKQYMNTLKKDSFLRGFLKDIYLRPACYECPFARLPRVADISLGDFWGISHLRPELDDDKGISLILVQTEKGMNFLNLCKKDLFITQANLDEAIKHNPAIIKPPGKHAERESFFADFDKLPFKTIENKYLKKNLDEYIYEIKVFLSKLLRR